MWTHGSRQGRDQELDQKMRAVLQRSLTEWPLFLNEMEEKNEFMLESLYSIFILGPTQKLHLEVLES